MTAQSGEILMIEDKKHSLLSTPLEELWSTEIPRPDLKVLSSGCWRGYVGKWEIIENELWLTDIALGELQDGSVFKVSHLFPDNPKRVKAQWFSGELRIPLGEQLEYEHIGFAQTYERDLFIDIKKGVVDDYRIMENIGKLGLGLNDSIKYYSKGESISEEEKNIAKYIADFSKTIRDNIYFLEKATEELNDNNYDNAKFILNTFVGNLPSIKRIKGNFYNYYISSIPTDKRIRLFKEIAKSELNDNNYLHAKIMYEAYYDYALGISVSPTGFLLNFSNQDYIDTLILFYELDDSPSNEIHEEYESIIESISYKQNKDIELNNEEQNVLKLACYNFDYTFSWGKYSETPIRKILIQDIEYVLWCIINLKHFSFSNILFSFKEARNHRWFKKALEINLIKQLVLNHFKIYQDDEYDEFCNDDSYYESDYSVLWGDSCSACHENPCMCSDSF